jgi:hypothetical protein
MAGSTTAYKRGGYKATLSRELTAEQRAFFEKKKHGIENFMRGCGLRDAEVAFEDFIPNFRMTSEEVSFFSEKFKDYPEIILQEAARRILFGCGVKTYGKPNIETIMGIVNNILQPIKNLQFNIEIILNADFEKTFVKKPLSPSAIAQINSFLGRPLRCIQ